MSQDSQSTIDASPYLAQESVDLYVNLDARGLNFQIEQIQTEEITQEAAPLTCSPKTDPS